MSETRNGRYAIVYDISADRERRRIDKLLKGWGHRVQKSVFMVTTNRAGIARLHKELDQLGIAHGSILILRLQAGSEAIAVGLPFADPDAEAAYVF